MGMSQTIGPKPRTGASDLFANMRQGSLDKTLLFLISPLRAPRHGRGRKGDIKKGLLDWFITTVAQQYNTIQISLFFYFLLTSLEAEQWGFPGRSASSDLYRVIALLRSILTMIPRGITFSYQ
jgi:hypothetical protein